MWRLIGGIAAGTAFLVGREIYRRSYQDAAARSAGLEPVDDLTHVPAALQRSALWSLSDGGFERRVLTGRFARTAGDVTITAFDLETLRERRGEWAYLPVEPPFRISGTVSVVACEIDRAFPHLVLKREGHGDDLADDDMLERSASLAKLARLGLGMSSHHPAELPPTLGHAPLAIGLADRWRAYGTQPTVLAELVAAGFNETLRRADRRDLVIELLDGLVVVYPAAREVDGADAFADLTSTALVIVDGLLAASPRVTPRGVDSLRA